MATEITLVETNATLEEILDNPLGWAAILGEGGAVVINKE